MGRRSEIQEKLKTSQDVLKSLRDSEKALNDMVRKVKEMNLEDRSFQLQLVEVVNKDLAKTKAEIDKSVTNEADDGMMKELKPLEEQLNNDFWSGQCKLSLLIAAGLNTPEDLKNSRPNTCCDETYEYYKYVRGEAAADLFGQCFMELLEVLKH